MHIRRMLAVATGAAIAAALALAAVPAAAAPLEVIAVKARVESQNGPTRGDYQIGDAVPAQVGERLKISLVGTGIYGGAGREVPIEARFFIAAGHNDLSLVGTGPSWALVSINGAGGNGMEGQLGYTAAPRYRMRPALASGRITFKVGPPPAPAVGVAGAVPLPEPPQGYRRERWHRAWEINRMLKRAILGDEPLRGDRARADADRIYREGYGGVLTVAVELARVAENRGVGRSPLERGYQERDVERLGALYRDLLHRQQSNRELWQQDPGFRNMVDALHRKGLPAVVEGIVDSDEFRSTNQIGPR